MKIKISEATQEERTNLFNFLVNRLKTECEFVLENGVEVLKSIGKITKSVSHHSSFYEFENNKFIDITEDYMIPFGYY